MSERVVVVGAGQAGAALVARLRALDPALPITLVGAEPDAPYQRPPLSKKYLNGEMPFDRLLLKPAEWYGEHAIELRLSENAVAIDRDRRVVVTDRDEIDYRHLVLATGATPRRLPEAIGGGLDGVHVMRDRADADRLASLLDPGIRLLVVGGGYIGLEAAAVAARRGLSVTLVEAAPRILGRVAATETADIIRRLHEKNGVVIREGVGLTRLVAEGGKARGAELDDGTEIPADVVVVGIGVIANDAIAARAGLDVSGGILVDENTRSSDPAIHAVGDCAVFSWRGRPIRLESVQNAVDQGEAAAAIIAGGTAPYVPKPWFWSDQYDTKLQIAGLNLGYRQTYVRPGPREGSASVWYFDGDELLAVDAIDDARAYMAARKLLGEGRTADPAKIVDPAFDLKGLLA